MSGCDVMSDVGFATGRCILKSREILTLLVKKRMRQVAMGKRKFWVHTTFRARKDLGEYLQLVFELRQDEKCFTEYFRLNLQQFD